MTDNRDHLHHSRPNKVTSMKVAKPRSPRKTAKKRGVSAKAGTLKRELLKRALRQTNALVEISTD